MFRAPIYCYLQATVRRVIFFMFVYVSNVQVFDRKTLTFWASQSTFGGVFNETFLRSWKTLIGLLWGPVIKKKGGGLGKIGGGSLFLSTVEGVGHRKLSAIIRVGHVKICRRSTSQARAFITLKTLACEVGRRLGHSHFFVLKISAQRTRYLFFWAKYQNLVWKMKIKSLESNCNVLFRKIFLPKKVVDGGGEVPKKNFPEP
jgi:hypothetical protein